MGHPSIENPTAFEFDPLFLADEEGRSLFVPVVKATYTIGPHGLTLSEEQVPVNAAGECYGEPGESSYRYEPECAFVKVATDVVLVGHAHAPQRGATEMLVAFQVGPVNKGVRVLGDRLFYKALGMVSMTKPAPFEQIPLQWERSFGGWDRSNPDPKKHQFEPRNPVGVGFRASGAVFHEGLRAPNIEDPAQPFKGWGNRGAPAGFGFTCPNWEPRVALGGTYDEKWQKERSPLLAKNFDRRFMNGAPQGQVAPGLLRGDEPVTVVGASALGRLSFRLPGLGTPKLKVERSGPPDAELALQLDTVIVDTDVMKVFLLWRSNLVLEREPLEIRSMELVWPGAPPAKAVGSPVRIAG
jgi:hypothetical protein